MKKVMVLLLVFALAVFVAACSSDSGGKKTSTGPDADGNAGTLDAHADLPNAAVTNDNVQAVSTVIQEAAFAAAGKAMQNVQSSKPAQPQVGGTIAGTISGEQGGTATVNGSWTFNATTYATTYQFTCVFSNYSDDNYNFIAGTMNFDYTMNSTTYAGNYEITGNIRFNGGFQGTQSFTYDITMNTQSGLSSFTYTSTVVSNGQTITYSYPVLTY